MTNITYLSIIDNILDNYKYSITEDSYTFMIEKKDGLYVFIFYDSLKQLKQVFAIEQVKAFGLERIANELEIIFLNNEPNE